MPGELRTWGNMTSTADHRPAPRDLLLMNWGGNNNNWDSTKLLEFNTDHGWVAVFRATRPKHAKGASHSATVEGPNGHRPKAVCSASLQMLPTLTYMAPTIWQS